MKTLFTLINILLKLAHGLVRKAAQPRQASKHPTLAVADRAIFDEALPEGVRVLLLSAIARRPPDPAANAERVVPSAVAWQVAIR